MSSSISSLSPSVQFYFKDSSSLDDSDIEDVLFDDDAEVLLTVKGAR
jgi:hypothetical protein